MNRRNFFAQSAAVTAGLTATGFLPGSGLMAQTSTANAIPEGPVTYYFEFRVSGPQHDAAMNALRTSITGWQQAPGFLSAALKQMSGDSTAVKNYPEAYKGVLAEAYLDGVRDQTQPYFYSLFVRFEDFARLRAAGISEAFDRAVLPLLHMVSPSPNGPVISPRPMSVYRGIFQTIAAGDRSGIYTSAEQIIPFLRRPAELPEKNTVTVANHVLVEDQGSREWEKLVAALLSVAQQTFQPANDPNGAGLPGARDNQHYRKALSTEILRNAFPDGELRAYLMHGVWESVWDHENSHLDPRFKAAAGPVGGGVAVGPVEPFYLTRVLAKS